MKKLLKAEMWDKMQYLFRNYYDRMMHCVLYYDGPVDEDALRREIYAELKPFFQTGLTKRVANLLEALRLEACAPDLPIKRDRICTGGENLFRGRRSV